MPSIVPLNVLPELTVVDPWRDLDELFAGFWPGPAPSDARSLASIRVDVTEQPQQYLVEAELPGYDKADIQVSIDGNVVSISAESKQSTDATAKNLLHRERYHGKCYRSLRLDADIDHDKAQANYRHGVLELTLPKKGPASRKLTVQ